MDLVLRRTDRELSAHLESLTVGAFSYGWPLLRSALSVVLSREDWRRLMDRIFANVKRPDLLEAAVVAFVVASRAKLFVCQSTSEAVDFFQHPQPSVAVDEMFRVMDKVSTFGPPERWSRERVVAVGNTTGAHGAGSRGSKRSPGDVDGTMAALTLLRTARREFEPLAAGSYPRYDGYPQFVVNYQAKMREMVLKQEKEKELKRQLVRMRGGRGGGSEKHIETAEFE